MQSFLVSICIVERMLAGCPPVLLDLPLSLAVPPLSVLLLLPFQLHALLFEALTLLHGLLSLLLLPHLLFTLESQTNRLKKNLNARLRSRLIFN